MKIPSVIVDDDLSVIESLKDLILYFDLEINLLGVANSVTEGIKLVEKVRPKLIILDIEMPDGKGFDLIRRLDYQPVIIFITGHSGYALEAFDYPAVHFLVKPIGIQNLKDAIQKYHNFQEKFKTNPLPSVVEPTETTPKHNKIAIPTSEGQKFFNIDSIIRLEGESNYTVIILTDGKRIMVSKTLSLVEKHLPQDIFLRVHKGHIINIHYVAAIPKNKNLQIEMTDGTLIGVPYERKQFVIDKLKNFAYFMYD
jgi:two-component system LytT family response regulator